jgi:hypothetical protein
MGRLRNRTRSRLRPSEVALQLSPFEIESREVLAQAIRIVRDALSLTRTVEQRPACGGEARSRTTDRQRVFELYTIESIE